jgi:O-acetyl-ADP-ribose deacetylase (regulator of RNase III)
MGHPTVIDVIRDDITRMSVDAIVNAANNSLIPGGGVDGAIHAAGGPTIAQETAEIIQRIGLLPTGEAVMTDAGALRSHHVIHTVGPIWGQTTQDEAMDLLEACYSNSLDLAEGQACASIAFPNISTGVYGVPKELAARSAVGAVNRWLGTSLNVIERIVFVCFDDENYRIYSELLAL